MEITSRMCCPSLMSPVKLDWDREDCRSIPFVKMRQAISCGIVVTETFSPKGSLTSCQVSSPRYKYQLPPHSPEMTNSIKVSDFAEILRYANGKARRKQSSTGK